MVFNREKDRLDISTNKPEIFYPEAKYIPSLPNMPTNGNYRVNFPEGIIIHYTAGDQMQSGESAVKQAIDHGYAYFFIDGGGHVFQQFCLSRWGYHAGFSKCPVTGRSSVSKLYVGIEVACAGRLTDEGKSWFGKRIAPVDIRKADPSYTVSGCYQTFTHMQEKSLLELCVWLCNKGVNPDLILGHYEVAPSRKDDPGPSLSVPMPKWRLKVKQELFNWKLLQPS
jgi:N-acetyl-anhydromuramyl-L-alanine amidase AmpD